VSKASVTVDAACVGAIETGLLVLVSVGQDDTEEDVRYMAEKVAGLRCFQDDASKFNRSVEEVRGAILAISQFTLHGDCRKGKRPSFSAAARPEKAVPLYEALVERLRARGIEVQTGVFGAHMQVELCNDGPVTLLIDSKKDF